MSRLSLVTAKIIRSNEQYSYKLVGKGEKYLVRHKELENVGEKVLEYLTPFAKEPVVINQVTLIANEVELISTDGENIYKATAEFIVLNEKTGVEKKKRLSYYVAADKFTEAQDKIYLFLDNTVTDYRLRCIQLTPIIEYLDLE